MKLFASLITASLFLVGCGYVPADLEENIPSIDDAYPDRDQVVFGTSTLRKTNDDGSTLCEVEQDIVGWVEEDEEVTIAGCVGCAELYTLALATTDGADCHSVSGLPTIAILDFELLQIVDPDFYNQQRDREPEGADGTPVSFVAINWIPSFGAQGTFEPRAVLHRKAEESGLPEFAREYVMFPRYRYGDGDGDWISWFADLRLTE
ncbi:MAG: hypothetical protein GY898_27625 [Proteobacteria bacterium]|nr:hypothetical protein [Pseudomonadota bacterium]